MKKTNLQESICLLMAAQVSFQLNAEVKRLAFLERRNLYLVMRYMRIYMHVNLCSSRSQQPGDTVKVVGNKPNTF